MGNQEKIKEPIPIFSSLESIIKTKFFLLVSDSKRPQLLVLTPCGTGGCFGCVVGVNGVHAKLCDQGGGRNGYQNTSPF
jgi:hypothetical protein